MSIVAVHGPNTWGSKAITEVGPAQAVVNPANGLIWTFKLDQPSTRTASLVWTYPTGTPATSTGPGPTTVTFASAGTKAVTAVATGAGEGANPYPPAGTTNLPVTAVSGAAPQLMMMEGGGESGEGDGGEETPPEDTPFDPADHTIPEVEDYVGQHPDELERIYSAEVDGKGRTTLLSWLEAQGTT